MKLFFKAKDGGSESKVTGYWLIESKRFFSIVLLRFDRGSREAYHNHAFNAWSWVLSGHLLEQVKEGMCEDYYQDVFPIYTPKNRFHKVSGIADKTWVLSFRGPWDKTWKEYLPEQDKEITLTDGRVIVRNI